MSDIDHFERKHLLLQGSVVHLPNRQITLGIEGTDLEFCPFAAFPNGRCGLPRKRGKASKSAEINE